MARILYVEGDVKRAGLLAPLLAAKGHMVDVVNCAERAMLRVQGDTGYAAVVLHLYLPGMDGTELCRWIEKSSAVKGIPKLVFTWQGIQSHVDVSRWMPRWFPADRFVQGLARPEELAEAVESMLAGGE